MEEIGRGVDCGCAGVTGALEMPPVAIVRENMEGEMDVAPTISVVVWRETGMEEIGRGVDCACA